ncbi:TRAP transporter small permease [Alteribacillus iranensis]|uniref:TRAP-type C4-dicarboxylate transport system, small permease component n=1 Tax=Alteribacillus iranensis TaxID=930128 RepID=A0A1I2ER37_9BACI|nr:TRAP transporter small permease [Alteribacillus iranensis]SFE94928.1 TRAP-type C4-dicarboxylate transport system, small permease component [Alteribacillus iranensis]
MMKVIKWLDNILRRVEEVILSLAILVITVMVAGNAVSRNFFGNSWAFAEEISQLALFMATFMGISYVARKGRHISMSALFDTVPFGFRKALALLIPLTTGIILLGLAYFSWGYVQSVIDSGRVTSALRLPYYIMIIWAPIGFVLGALQFFRNFWVNVRNKDVYLAAERKDYDDDTDVENPPSI